MSVDLVRVAVEPRPERLEMRACGGDVLDAERRVVPPCFSSSVWPRPIVTPAHGVCTSPQPYCRAGRRARSRAPRGTTSTARRSPRRSTEITSCRSYSNGVVTGWSPSRSCDPSLSWSVLTCFYTRYTFHVNHDLIAHLPPPLVGAGARRAPAPDGAPLRGARRQARRRPRVAPAHARLRCSRSASSARNPGYGHPLRPEYVLTTQRRGAARRCAALLARGRRRASLLRKWSLPVLAALAAAAPLLRAAAPRSPESRRARSRSL